MKCFGAFTDCSNPISCYFILFNKVHGLCKDHSDRLELPSYPSYEEAQLALVKRKL